MKKLTIFYDAQCYFCRRSTKWLRDETKFFELDFVPAGTPEAKRILSVVDSKSEKELIVVSDEGAIYSGPNAFIMCLYALTDYRELALRLSHPVLLPLARKAFMLLSEYRSRLVWYWRLKDTTDLRERLEDTCGREVMACVSECQPR